MTYDVAIIGAGIVGLATALSLLEKKPTARVLILEKEAAPALHQSKNNSGVIHSGIYYKPGSEKARNCQLGYQKLLDFCNKHDINHNICGKIIAAVDQKELVYLEELKQRGVQNGLTDLRYLTPEETKEKEPYLHCIKALWVPQTGVIDFREVALKLASLIQEKGAVLHLSKQVVAIKEGSSQIEIVTTTETYIALQVVNCGGLHCDKLAGSPRDVRVIPFRGEYWKIKEEKEYLVNGLIYPVPNPDLPFLGVHFTRRINGVVDIGPNAVLAFSREGYSRTSFRFADVGNMLAYPGFWRMSARFAGVGVQEMSRSISKQLFLKKARRYLPMLETMDVKRGTAGVRAQAVDRKGNLIYDFNFTRKGRIIHVLNTPSPAATSCLSVGATIVELLD